MKGFNLRQFPNPFFQPGQWDIGFLEQVVLPQMVLQPQSDGGSELPGNKKNTHSIYPLGIMLNQFFGQNAVATTRYAGRYIFQNSHEWCTAG